MFLLERRSEAAEILERVLYNTVLHGLSLSGTNSYYQNPLSDHDNPRYNSWVCCPPNLSRTLLQVGRYAYAHTDRDLYVNLFAGGTVRVPLASSVITVRVETDFPWDGKVKFHIEGEASTRFALRVRKPGWCDQATLALNGSRIENQPDDSGYWVFDRDWKRGDTLDLVLDQPVRRWVAHPNIAACQGKVALLRGPLVYGFEGLDNRDLAALKLSDNPKFSAEHRPDLLGGITVIRGTAVNGQPLLAIPFYALANREKSFQEVWVEQAGLRQTEAWWLGHLYRSIDSPSR
jgi:DUF1680 family protein